MLMSDTRSKQKHQTFLQLAGTASGVFSKAVQTWRNLQKFCFCKVATLSFEIAFNTPKADHLNNSLVFLFYPFQQARKDFYRLG